MPNPDLNPPTLAEDLVDQFEVELEKRIANMREGIEPMSTTEYATTLIALRLGQMVDHQRAQLQQDSIPSIKRDAG